jgi:transcriptional regulator with XRE-family HTH domain
MAADHKVGQGVRVLRQRKGWTLEELSSRCGLSISFLSQVERGLSSLSIPSLHSICEALEVPITHFLATTTMNGPLVVRTGEPHNRVRIGDSHTHEGEEFGYVLEGEVTLQVEENKETLTPGDSFHILSSQPHTVQNPTDKPARILWVLTMKLLEGGGHL